MKKYCNKYLVFSVIIGSLYTIISPLNAVFADTPDYDFYSGNDIIFYDPSATSACNTGGTIIVTTSKEALANLKQSYAYFIAKGLTDFQAAAIVGNIQAESGGYTNRQEGFPPGQGPSTPAGLTRQNQGWGLVGWTPGEKALDIQKAAGIQGAIVDLQTQLDMVWWVSTTHGGANKWWSGTQVDNLKSTSDVVSATTEWMNDFERPNAQYAHLDNRIAFAKTALSTFPKTVDGQAPSPTPSTPGASSNVGASCGSSSPGIVQGDIVKTALGFALEQPVDNTTSGWKAAAKPSFVAAVQQYDSSVLSLGEAAYADCGIFVATVMHASGVDKDYPDSSTATQINYLKSQTDKYQIIYNPQLGTGPNSLQPGDILIVNNGKDHHTMIYTGEIGTDSKTGAKLIAVDASQEQRPPSYRTTASVQSILSKSGVIAARHKGGS